jgi:hypothetical protein
MEYLRATGIRLQADQKTTGGFVLNGRRVMFDWLFKAPPSLVIGVSERLDTKEMVVRWEATGIPANAWESDVTLQTQEGAIPDDPPGWWKQD